MNELRRQALINALVNRPNEHNFKLQDLENEAIDFQQQEDWIWHALIRSLATLGGAAGYDNLINNGNIEELDYQYINDFAQINNWNNDDIKNHFYNLFSAAIIRYSNRKSNYMLINYQLFANYNAVIALSNALWQMENRNEFIRYVIQFHGIGQKYARNIAMDLKHPAFTNSIAIDSRIEKILSALEYHGGNAYEEKEEALLNIAQDAEITGWQLDRLLFNFNGYYLQIINQN